MRINKSQLEKYKNSEVKKMDGGKFCKLQGGWVSISYDMCQACTCCEDRGYSK